MMKQLKPLLALVLIAAMLLGPAVPARAAVMTLEITYTGIREGTGGSTETIPLSGSFRVFQNGIEIGIIQAGGETIMLAGTDAISIEPMPETMDPAWNWSEAYRQVEMTGGEHVNVAIAVHQATPETAMKEPDAAEPEKPEEPAETEVPGEEPGTDGTDTEPDEASKPDTVDEAPVVAKTEVPLPTEVPRAEATPEPELSTLAEGADTGTVQVRVFVDKDFNGSAGAYEVGAGGIPVYVVSGGEAVAGGKTDAEGYLTLTGIPAGEYSIRVVLPSEYSYSKKGKGDGLGFSCTGYAVEQTQDSESFRLSAGATVERGIGVNPAGSVSGLCWLDSNTDGIMDADEPRIAGVRITVSGKDTGVTYETWSDASGNWRIDGIAPGTCRLSGYTPEGMMFTRYSKTGGKNRSIFTTEGKTRQTKEVEVRSGRTVEDQNIGFALTATIEGICYLDANYNGLYDEGEQPLAGVKISAIKQARDEEIAVTTTGTDGRFSLTGMRGNTYKIRALLPDDGVTFTRLSDEPLGNRFQAREGRRENFWTNFLLKDGESREVNVGAIYYASLSGTVYLDNDFSATRDGGENTVAGVTVTLLDGAGSVVDKAVTKANGEYRFEKLTPGKYTLVMTAKEGYAFTRTGAGSVMLNRTGGEGYTEPFDVPLGAAVTGMDAGMIKPARVEGTVFADANDNGMQDAGESGLDGVTVRLMSSEGQEAFRTELSGGGSFLFDAVMPGRYRLEYDLPENAIFAKVIAGGNSISGESGTGAGEWFDISSGGAVTAPLCGALTLGRLSGTVFYDHDASGIREAGDDALSGAFLYLIPSRDDLEPVEAATEGDGAFALENLHPDTYTLRLSMPEGMVLSRMKGVTLPLASGQEAQEVQLTVGMGQVWENQMLGAVLPASLSGRAWMDENNNGLMDPGEATPANLEITVTDELTGEVFAKLRTDGDGFFGTEGMIPGSFAVSWALDADTKGSQSGDTTFRQEENQLRMSGIALGEGESRNDLLMGFVRYTSVGGSVWIDRSGTVEPLSGAEIVLEAEGGETMRPAAGESAASFRFDGLMPGRYRLHAELPDGHVVVEPGDDRLNGGLISVLTETDGVSGVSEWFDLRMGENRLSMDIGSVLPGTIGDFCWLDSNRNGWQDGGEYALEGVTIELLRDGMPVASTTTDIYGRYRFRNLYPAEYTLRVTPPAEVMPTVKKTDIPLISSVLNETEEYVCVSDPFRVQSDAVNYNIDLGFVLRQEGVYPDDLTKGKEMDWSIRYGIDDE